MATFLPKSDILTRYTASIDGKEFQVDFINPNLEEVFFIGENGTKFFEGTVSEFMTIAHTVQEQNIQTKEFHPVTE